MKKLFRSYGLAIFALVTVLDLAGITAHYELLHRIAKPLLMPVLIITLLYEEENATGKKLLLAGLFFSFLGDTFLLFDQQYPICFIFGLLSFLVTHIFYIVYFLKIPATAPSLFKQRPGIIFPVVVYVIGFLWLLVPKLGALTVPVIIYALVLGSMLLCSIHIFLRVPKKVAILFAAGATLFVISDSMLAINRFYTPLPASGFLVMLSYCAAQAFIVAAHRLR